MLQMRLIQVQSELTSQKAKKKQLQEKFDQLEEQTTAKALGSGDPKYVKATVMSMQVKLAEKDKLIEKLNAMIKKLETANEIMSRDEFRSSPVEYIYELTRERDELVKRVEQLEGDKVGDAEDTCTE